MGGKGSGRKPSVVKSCPKCGETDHSKFGPNRRRRDRLQVWCRRCTDAHFTPEMSRQYWLKHKYGLSTDEYQAMLLEQHDLCALCNKPFEDQKGLRPVVDHDHSTQAVRGIIHQACNSMLGHAHDDPTVLAAGIRYLDGAKNLKLQDKRTISLLD